MKAVRAAIVLVIVIMALGLMFAIIPELALAAENWGVLGAFGAGPCEVTPSEHCEGKFKELSGIAVNSATGDVYVVDKGNKRVEEFSATGTFIKEFAPPGGFEDPDEIAVDNSGKSVSEDPSVGDVYVIDTGHNVVDKFTAAGAYLGQIAGTCPAAGTCSAAQVIPFVELAGVAVDPNGIVWIEDERDQQGRKNPAIDNFGNEQPNGFIASRVYHATRFVHNGLAVDSKDNLYLIENDALGEAAVTKLNSSAGEPIGEVLGGVEVVSGVAVDSASDDVYIDAGASVAVVSSAESLLESFGGGLLSQAGSLAVNPAAGTSGYAYVAEPGANDVLFFQHSATATKSPAAPPTDPATEVTGISFELHGELNPEKAEGGVGYYFSYHAGAGSTCTEPGSERTPLDNGGLNLTGDSPISVFATVVLHPHEEYVYCLVAVGYGPTPGNEVPLTTTGEKPKVISESVSSSGPATGEFVAMVNSESEETTSCHFQYSTELSGGELQNPKNLFCSNEPLQPVFEAQRAYVEGVELEEVADTYYYRVVVKNGTGETKGPIEAYTKLPTVGGEQASELTLTSATLEATQLNPFWQETKYRFEYSESKTELEHGNGIVIHGATGKQQQKKLEELTKEEERLKKLEEEGKVAPGTVPLCPGIVEDGGAGTLPGVVDKPSCPVSAELSGLRSNTVYYYRVVAENATTENVNNANDGKPAAGEIEQFKTESQPFATTGGVQSITSTSATLSGSVTPLDQTTTYYFQYISETAYQKAVARGVSEPYGEGETTAPLVLGASPDPQAVGPIPAGGLLPEQTYRYRLVAKNRWGIEYGEPLTFTTAAAEPPLVSTGAAINISPAAATLTGTVTTNGLATSYGFEVATTPGGYGPVTGLGTLGGVTKEGVSATLDNLQPGTTYYYRVTATNIDGTADGEPGAFTTPGLPSVLGVPVAPAFLGFTIPTTGKPTVNHPKPPSVAEKLKKALKACSRDKSKTRRAQCEKAARKKYKVPGKKRGRKK